MSEWKKLADDRDKATAHTALIALTNFGSEDRKLVMPTLKKHLADDAAVTRFVYWCGDPTERETAKVQLLKFLREGTQREECIRAFQFDYKAGKTMVPELKAMLADAMKSLEWSAEDTAYLRECIDYLEKGGIGGD